MKRKKSKINHDKFISPDYTKGGTIDKSLSVKLYSKKKKKLIPKG